MYANIKSSKIMSLILAKLQGMWTDVVNPSRVFIIHQTRLDQLVTCKYQNNVIISSSHLFQEFKNVRIVGNQENIVNQFSVVERQCTCTTLI